LGLSYEIELKEGLVPYRIAAHPGDGKNKREGDKLEY
jgi:hypothetical protein